MKRFEFLCGGIAATSTEPDVIRRTMDVQGKRTVNLSIADISRVMVANVVPLMLDLLEIAAYIYCGDQRARRGGDKLSQAGQDWRREMRYVIPVRCPEIWASAEVREALEHTLDFLSDDRYEFEFVEAAAPLAEPVLYFPDLADGAFEPDEIALFSGGLDSFAGAVESIGSLGRKTVLVAHYSAPKVLAVQKELVRALARAGFESQFMYIPVTVTNTDIDSAEPTQRSRSFLFASLAFVLAQMFGKDGFTFYENGVVSLNLPVAHDVLGARATRTTHPQVIRGFERIFSLLAKRQIEIATPYLWITKTEIVERVVAAGFGQLLGRTVSCVHPMQWTIEVRHCGRCSQCIDRRFAVLAAGAAEFDPADGYEVDLLTGRRESDEDIRMAVAYVKFWREMSQSGRQQFPKEHPDIFSVVDHVRGFSPEEVLDSAWSLLHRHSEAVNRVIDTGIKENSQRLVLDNFPRGALLKLCFSRDRIEAPPVADPLDQVTAFLDRLSESVCDFAVDAAARCIWFRGGLSIDGADYELVEKLLPNHRDAKSRCEDVPLFYTPDLAAALDIDEPALRKRVGRCRKAVEDRLTVDHGIILAAGFIENVHGRGYRLAPELREVSRADLGLPREPASQAY